jgi:hypothetical protein
VIAFPNFDYTDKIADWVELYVLLYNRQISKSMLVKTISREYPELDDDYIEPIVDSVFNELEMRLKQYGIVNHYQVSGKNILPLIKWSDFPELTMCLIFSLYGVVKEKGKNDGTKYFELLSNIAIKSFFACESMVLGFPTKSNLSTQINTFITVSSENKGHKPPRPSDKDKGVDIIAWKPFADKRNNQWLLFMQCGAGLHFNAKKPMNINGWKRIIDFAVDPMTGIAIPALINDQNLWEDISDYYRIIFDRARLIKNIFNSPHIDPSLRKKIKNWCNSRLN